MGSPMGSVFQNEVANTWIFMFVAWPPNSIGNPAAKHANSPYFGVFGPGGSVDCGVCG
jgi:hypothetical protein